METERLPFPPFIKSADAALKVRLAEDAWNGRNPAKVAMAYTPDSRWRNRAEFITGRAAIESFLTRTWHRELGYRFIKELWAFNDNRIAVRFAYEWHDDSGSWFRSYGNENWEFNERGLMRWRIASINDVPIIESERKFLWPLGLMVHLGIQRPLGQGFLQSIQQAIGIKRRLGVGSSQKLVQQLVRDVRGFASGHLGASFASILLAPHEIPDRPSEHHGSESICLLDPAPSYKAPTTERAREPRFDRR